MNKFFIKAFMALNTFVIRASRGYLGTLLLSQTVLLLHTVGRRSGRHFITPISYFQADDYYFLVGSNWGRRHNAGWYYNLLAQPHTTIEVRGREIPAEARQAEGQEYNRLWEIAVKRYRGYSRYKAGTKRHIPIIILQSGRKT
jgi:deazaflavin-dependent oxidoreductase (nitroreductase family)